MRRRRSRGMQVGVRDLRLANNAADMQKANDYIAARLKSVEPFCRRDAETVQVRRESRPHREAQGEGGDYCERRSADRGCSQRSDRRGRRRCRSRSEDCEAERRSHPHRPRSHAADRCRTRAARQPDRRFRQAQRGRAGRPGRQRNGHGRMGIHGHRHRHDAVADRHQHILLLHDRPSDARVERVDGRTRRRQFRRRAARALAARTNSVRSPAPSRNSRSSRSRRPARRRKPRSSRTRSRRSSARPRWSGSRIPSRRPSARSSKPCHRLRPNSKPPPAR